MRSNSTNMLQEATTGKADKAAAGAGSSEAGKLPVVIKEEAALADESAAAAQPAAVEAAPAEESKGGKAAGKAAGKKFKGGDASSQPGKSKAAEKSGVCMIPPDMLLTCAIAFFLLASSCATIK
jgi:hypothetical protein